MCVTPVGGYVHLTNRASVAELPRLTSILLGFVFRVGAGRRHHIRGDKISLASTRTSPVRVAITVLLSAAVLVGAAATPAAGAETTQADSSALFVAMTDPDVDALAQDVLSNLQLAVTSPVGGSDLLSPSGVPNGELVAELLGTPVEPVPPDGVHDEAIRKVNDLIAAPAYSDAVTSLRDYFLSPAGAEAMQSLDPIAAAYINVLMNSRSASVDILDTLDKYSVHILAAVAIGINTARCLASGPVSPLCVAAALTQTLALQATVVVQIRNDATHNVTIRNVFCTTPNHCEHFGEAHSSASASSWGASYYFDVQAGGGTGAALGGGANRNDLFNTSTGIGIVKTYDVFGLWDDGTGNSACYATVEVLQTVIWTDGYASRDKFKTAKPVKNPC